MTKLIEDYALIGDCETAALVHRTGSIDWLCWPRFDSGAMFAALLGGPENGRWIITADDPTARFARRYRGSTVVLETTIETGTGAVTLTDFMPLRTNGTSHLVRLVRGHRGRIQLTTEIIFRFDYGSILPWVTRVDDNSIRAEAGANMVVLRSDAMLKAERLKHCGRFEVAAGQEIAFVLSHGRSYGPLPEPTSPLGALEATERAWTEWASQYQAPASRYSEAVLRSLITLKALTYRPTGGIIAAPTTSLPETLGGQRNWDYRNCWLRDATFTLLALWNCGFHQEAAHWRTWLRRAVAGSPAQVQIMYGLAGERTLNEWEVP